MGGGGGGRGEEGVRERDDAFEVRGDSTRFVTALYIASDPFHLTIDGDCRHHRCPAACLSCSARRRSVAMDEAGLVAKGSSRLYFKLHGMWSATQGWYTFCCSLKPLSVLLAALQEADRSYISHCAGAC